MMHNDWYKKKVKVKLSLYGHAVHLLLILVLGIRWG
jgi:hypothetical protein